MTSRTLVMVACGALLILASATTCGYERGVKHGASITLVSRDDSVHKADKTLTETLVQRTRVADALTKEAIVERDTAQAREEKAQARRDTSRAFAHAERARFTLKGDTAIIDGLEYVLPQTVTTSIRLTDTLLAKQGELDAMRAESDSNASRTIARLEESGATKDTLITDLNIAVKHDEGEIKDLKAMHAPRLSFTNGVLVGAGGILVAIVGLLHFVR